MALRYFIYGEVAFASANKRSAAARRLDQRAARAGFEPTLWEGLVEAYGSWPAGKGEVDIAGQPGLRFCYATLDQAVAEAATVEVAEFFEALPESNSFWGYAAQPL